MSATRFFFDRRTGDFSHPEYVITSDANGFYPSLEVSSATMSTIATLAGDFQDRLYRSNGLSGHSEGLKMSQESRKAKDVSYW